MNTQEGSSRLQDAEGRIRNLKDRVMVHAEPQGRKTRINKKEAKFRKLRKTQSL